MKEANQTKGTPDLWPELHQQSTTKAGLPSRYKSKGQDERRRFRLWGGARVPDSKRRNVLGSAEKSANMVEQEWHKNRHNKSKKKKRSWAGKQGQSQERLGPCGDFGKKKKKALTAEQFTEYVKFSG